MPRLEFTTNGTHSIFYRDFDLLPQCHSYPAMATETTAPPPAARRNKTPGFVDSFWSSDYAGGLGVLFTKLQQGVAENQQILTIATMRAEAEDMYSERLGDIAPTIDRINGGFSRDDGASVRKVRFYFSTPPRADELTPAGIRRSTK